jgi:hypothetical protein
MAETPNPSPELLCCRFCACDKHTPCKVPGGDECAFIMSPQKRVRCTAPGCIAAFERERRLEIEEDRARRRMLAVIRDKNKRFGRNRQRRVV